MTAEATNQSRPFFSGARSDFHDVDVTRQSNVLPDYKPFAGHSGSSEYNWVPVDYLISKLADILHVSDEDLKKKS